MRNLLFLLIAVAATVAPFVALVLLDRRAQRLRREKDPLTLFREWRREIRIWGAYLLVTGFVQASGVNPNFTSISWGSLVIIVGLFGLFVTDVSMYVVFATVIGWAAVASLGISPVSGLALTLVQTLFVLLIAVQYRKYRGLDYGEEPPPGAERAARRANTLLPPIGFGAGVVSLLGTTAIILILGIVTLSEYEPAPPVYLLPNFALNLGVMGVGFGLAALLSDHRRRRLALAGLVASGATLFIWIVLTALVRLFGPLAA